MTEFEIEISIHDGKGKYYKSVIDIDNITIPISGKITRSNTFIKWGDEIANVINLVPGFIQFYTNSNDIIVIEKKDLVKLSRLKRIKFITNE